MNRKHMLIEAALGFTAGGLIWAIQPGVACAGPGTQPPVGGLLPVADNVPLLAGLLVLVACLVCVGVVGLRRGARRPAQGCDERKTGRER